MKSYREFSVEIAEFILDEANPENDLKRLYKLEDDEADFELIQEECIVMGVKLLVRGAIWGAGIGLLVGYLDPERSTEELLKLGVTSGVILDIWQALFRHQVINRWFDRNS